MLLIYKYIEIKYTLNACVAFKMVMFHSLPTSKPAMVDTSDTRPFGILQRFVALRGSWHALGPKKN